MPVRCPIPLTVKLGLDMVMTLLFVTSLAFRITGEERHEWIGTFLCALFLVHGTIGLRWFKKLLKGRYGIRRATNTAVNVLLLLVMVVLCVTGAMNSRYVFGFSQFSHGGMAVRQVHTFAAYWGLILIGIHTGLHWGMIGTVMQKTVGIGNNNRTGLLILYFVSMTIAAYGVWASFDRDMGSKLFLGFSFDFWAPDRPKILFFTHTLSIVGLYALLAHYALRFVGKLGKDRPVSPVPSARSTGFGVPDRWMGGKKA